MTENNKIQGFVRVLEDRIEIYSIPITRNNKALASLKKIKRIIEEDNVKELEKIKSLLNLEIGLEESRWLEYQELGLTKSSEEIENYCKVINELRNNL